MSLALSLGVEEGFAVEVLLLAVGEADCSAQPRGPCRHAPLVGAHVPPRGDSLAAVSLGSAVVGWNLGGARGGEDEWASVRPGVCRGGVGWAGDALVVAPAAAVAAEGHVYGNQKGEDSGKYLVDANEDGVFVRVHHVDHLLLLE